MAGAEGSSLSQTQPPRAQQQFPPHLPQVLRPTNRLFPIPSPSPSPAAAAPPPRGPLPSSFDPHLPFSDFKGRFLRPEAAAVKKFPAAAGDAAGKVWDSAVLGVINKDKILDQSRVPAPEKEKAPSALPAASVLLKQTNETKDQEVKSEGAVDQGQTDGVGPRVLPTASITGGKRCRKQKGSKNKRGGVPTPGSNDGSPDTLHPVSGCRYDSSLGLLTKKFINLLQQAEDGTLDLNKAAEILDVQKRRIYDITNVLEGVGLIEKKLKNRIRWKGLDMSRPKELDDQIAALKAHVETLYTEECRLDGMLREMQENLRFLSEDESNHKWLYVTQDDINNLPCFADDTLIAIKAPHGTSLEVPDPEEGIDFPNRRYQILLRSSMGPIDCYLIRNHEERVEATGHAPQSAPTDLTIENSGDNKDEHTLLPPADRDTSMTSEADAEGACQKSYSDSICSQDFIGGIMKIVPSDVDMNADYWLLSDLGASITDTWRTECILQPNFFHLHSVCMGHGAV